MVGLWNEKEKRDERWRMERKGWRVLHLRAAHARPAHLSLSLSLSLLSLTTIVFLPALVAASAASPASRRTNSDAHAAVAATASWDRRGGGEESEVVDRARMSLASLAMVAVRGVGGEGVRTAGRENGWTDGEEVEVERERCEREKDALPRTHPSAGRPLPPYLEREIVCVRVRVC